MKTIRITRHGVFRSGTDMVPIGTLIDVPDDFDGWPGKWVLVSESKGKTLQPATPDHTPGNVPLDEVDEHAESDDLHDLRAEFERIFGEKPHGRMKADTIRARISEAQ